MELLSVTQWQKLRKPIALRVTGKRPVVRIYVTEKCSGQYENKVLQRLRKLVETATMLHEWFAFV